MKSAHNNLNTPRLLVAAGLLLGLSGCKFTTTASGAVVVSHLGYFSTNTAIEIE